MSVFETLFISEQIAGYKFESLSEISGSLSSSFVINVLSSMFLAIGISS